MDLSLARISAALAALGRPDVAYPIVHVAGTDGKGSVCALLAAGLRHHGLTVGLFVSPFLREPRDAVTVNGAPVSESEWRRLAAAVSAAAAAAVLTQFEAWTAAAFLHFQAARVDVAVIEVGLGGTLDATNACPVPTVAVITHISLDHVAYLGGTVAEIAAHKAGIIKPGGRVVIATGGSQPPEAVATIAAAAAAVGAASVALAPPLEWLDAARRIAGRPATEPALRVPVPLLGEHQLANAGAAVEAMKALASSGAAAFAPLAAAAAESEEPDGGASVLCAGFAAASWPGRMSWVDLPASALRGGGGTVPLRLRCLVDGGHNAAGLRAVADEVAAVAARTGARHVAWVFASATSRPLADTLAQLLRPLPSTASSPARRSGGGGAAGDVPAAAAGGGRGGGLAFDVRSDALLAVPFSPPEGMPWVRPHAPAAIVAEAAASLLRCAGSSLAGGAEKEEEEEPPRLPLVACETLGDALALLTCGAEAAGCGGAEASSGIDARQRGCNCWRGMLAEGWRSEETLVVITGSLYLMSDVYRQI